METALQPFFGIVINHAYFAAGGCPALVLSPRGWSNGPNARLRLVGKGGGEVFVDRRIVARARAGDRMTWSFDLTPVDAEFARYTMPTRPAGSIVVFDHKPGTVSNEATLVLAPIAVESRPRRFMQSIPDRYIGRKIEIVRYTDKRVVRTIAGPSASAPACAIDIGGEPDGRYCLRIGKTVILDFHASDNVGALAWGVIDVDVGEPAETGLRVVIDLATRAAIWRYHIVDGSGGDRAIETSTLILQEKDRSATPRATFALVERQKVRGQPAFVFQSSRPLALTDRPADQFKLMLRGDGGDRQRSWSEPLPFAAARHVVCDPSGEARADIFVYL